MVTREEQARQHQPITSSQPIRACLSGEDLDWLGGRSVCVALGLHTTVEVSPSAHGDGFGERIAVEPWATEIWNHLRTRIPEMAAGRPWVRATTRAPSASGLSSSTALILALFEAFNECVPEKSRLPVDTLMRWAYEFEFEIFNGGGMDQASIVLGGATLFEGRPRGLPVVAEHVAFPGQWALLVVDSGTPKCTKDHIGFVRDQVAAADTALSRYMEVATGASDSVWSALRSGDLTALGEGMEVAHTVMRDCQGMSTALLEKIRDAAWDATRLRLKVSGAGGGGALVGVCSRDEAESAAQALRRRFRTAFPGVRVLVVDAVPPREAW